MRYEILTLVIVGIITASSLFINQNAYADIKLDPTPFYYNDSGTFVPYKLINTSNNATVIINSGSFVFDKNTCSISFYNKTSTSGSPVVGSDTYQVLASNTNNGTTNWKPVGIINNAACSTVITEHNGTISIVGTRSVLGGGSFTVNYTKSPFNPLKLTFSATNSNPAWTNYHLGIRELIQVPKIVTLGNTTYDLSQHNNTGLNRAYISSHRSQVISLANNIKYNMGLGWNNANSITDIWRNNQANLQIDYTYNTPILSPGNTISIDPNFDTSNICRTDSATTCSVTVGNNPNRLLVAVMHYGTTKATSYAPTAVKIGSTSFTKLTDKEGDGSANGAYVSVWYLVNPPTGSQTVTVTWGASTPPYSEIGLISFYNVKQSQPINPASFTTAGNAASSSETISITPTISKSWIAAVCTSMEDCNTPSGTGVYTSFADLPGTQIIASAQYNSAPTIGSSNTFTWGGTALSTVGTAKIAFEIENNKSPTIPVLTKVNTINSTAINATWASVPNAQWYQLNKTTPIGGTMTQYANTTSLFQVVTGLTPGTQYQFILAAGNSTGISLGSVTKYNYTFNVAPTVPTLSSITASQMHLGWTNPTGGANLTGGFNIYKVTALGSNYTLLAQTSNSTNHYDPISLQGNREYTFKIATRYAVGTNYTGMSANSTLISGYTLPGTPTGLSASQLSPLIGHLSWTPVSDNGTLLGTKIEQSIDGGTTWTTKIANTGNASTTANVAESSSGNYKFRVSSIKYGGTSGPSNVASITIWNGLLITVVKADNSTLGSGNIYQSNATSLNNIFSASTGSVVIPSLFNSQNFTFKDSSTLFVTGKQYNVNATAPNTLRMITNDFYVDCASDGTGTDFEWFTNGTTNHIISSFSSPICYTNNTVKWKVDFKANGNSPTVDTSSIRIQVLNNTFGMNPTKITANGTTITSSYAAPWIISNAFTVGSGNINEAIYFSANMALNPAYIPTNYTSGSLNVTGSNNNIQPIQISSNTVGSNTVVTFTYPSTYTLGVTANMLLENKTASFSGLPRTVVDAAHVSSSITFKNATSNDVIKIKAFDTKSNNNANYSLAMNSGSIPILTQIANFRNGTYGTHGQFGNIDLIVLIVLIFSMIGLNRVSETVGLIFNLVVIGGFSFYGILPFDKTIYAGIAMIALIIVGSTKKLPWS